MPGVGALTNGGDALAMFGLAAIGFAVPASQVTGVETQVSATMLNAARQRR